MMSPNTPWSDGKIPTTECSATFVIFEKWIKSILLRSHFCVIPRNLAISTPDLISPIDEPYYVSFHHCLFARCCGVDRRDFDLGRG